MIRSFSWLFAFALAAGSSTTLAQDQDSRAERAQQLERVLGSFAAQAHDGRVAMAVAQGAVGVLTLAPGIALVTRDDSNLRALGTGFIVAGAVNLVTLPFLLFPTTIEALYAELHQPAADGGNGQVFVEKLEAELQEAAQRQRSRRPIQAATLFALGVPAVGVGMTFLLAKPGLVGMKAGTQRDWGALLTAIGLPYLSFGIVQLFQSSPEEAAWALYQSETQHMPTMRASVSLAPVVGGASANMSLTF